MARGNRPFSASGSTTFVIVLMVVAVLRLARTVFIPLSLAILLSFLLAPAVIRVRHWRVGRLPAVIAVMLLVVALLGIVGSLMFSQLADLGRKLPGYQQTFHHKIESIRSSGGGWLNRATRLVRNFTDELTPAPSPSTSPPGERPVPVEIRRSPFSPLEVVRTILGSVLNILLTIGIVIVFVMFMLMEHENLRNRFIRLAGARRLHVTTSLLDDAAHRVSRYLLAQLVVNVGYGLLVGTGLFLMGVPNPLLWGLSAALLRYIPYLGVWIAAAMPAAVAFAVEAGWVKVPAVFGLYLGLDLLVYNFAEPLLYGSSTGLSPLAILVAAVFWTWLWGPVGLLLATPLTVCVVVIGRHVPRLGFLEVLLSDEPVLTPKTRFYQRLLALDADEATDIAYEFLKDGSRLDLYDSVIIPALSLAEEDRHSGKLDGMRQRFILEQTRLLLEDLARQSRGRPGRAYSRRRWRHRERVAPKNPSPGTASVLCLPARDEADELAATMLAQLLQQRGIAAGVSSSSALVGEALQQIATERPKIVCVVAVPPFGYAHARYFCRRFQAQFPGLKLLAAILTEQDVGQLKERQPPLCADELATSLRQVMTQLQSLLPVESVEPDPSHSQPVPAEPATH